MCPDAARHAACIATRISGGEAEQETNVIAICGEAGRQSDLALHAETLRPRLPRRYQWQRTGRQSDDRLERPVAGVPLLRDTGYQRDVSVW